MQIYIVKPFDIESSDAELHWTKDGSVLPFDTEACMHRKLGWLYKFQHGWQPEYCLSVTIFCNCWIWTAKQDRYLRLVLFLHVFDSCCLWSWYIACTPWKQCSHSTLSAFASTMHLSSLHRPPSTKILRCKVPTVDRVQSQIVGHRSVAAIYLS